MAQTIHTSCPKCGRPLVIMWTRETSPRERITIRCPHEAGGVRCTGTVEAVLPVDAEAVAEPPDKPTR